MNLGAFLVYALTLVPIAAFVAGTAGVIAYPISERLLAGQDSKVHEMLTVAVLVNVCVVSDILPKVLFGAISSLIIVSALTLQYFGLTKRYSRLWGMWYLLIGSTGVLTAAGSIVSFKFAEVFAEYGDYNNELLFRMIPTMGLLSHTSFSLYVLHSTMLAVELEKFYSQFAEKWLHEQGRDFFFLGSVFLLLSVASVGLFSDFIMSAAGCACYWLSFSLYGFTREVEEIMPWLGFTSSFVSSLLKLLLFQVDKTKTYTFFLTLKFLSTLNNSLLGVALTFLSFLQVARQHRLFHGYSQRQLLLPGRIAMGASSVTLLLGAHPRYKGTPKQFLLISGFAVLIYLFSLFIFYAKRDPRLVLYRRQEYNRGRNRNDGILAWGVFLWVTFSTSFVSTFCYFFVHVQVEEGKAPELVASVKALAEFLNILTGGVAIMFSVFIENLYGETMQLLVYLLLQMALRAPF